MKNATATSARLANALTWGGAVLAWSALLFSYRYLDNRLAGSSDRWLEPLVNELSAGLAAGLLFFAVRDLVRRRPLERGSRLRRLPLYLGAALAFAAAHTTMMWAMRETAYPLVGLGDFDYGRMPLRYFMELPMQAIGFATMVGALHAFAGLRRARERELRASQLEANLARAQLDGLRSQLQPHFLFNALNTISSTMYDDPRKADEMIEALADLLRASLRTARADEVALGEELALLDRYLAIQRARFGDRLDVRIALAPEASEAAVPPLLLQPLVENAVRHGGAELSGAGTIGLSARVDGGRLVVEVEDDGPGAPAERGATGGLGLEATRERLRLLYGDRHRFEAGNRADGGFRVRIEIPLRAAAEAG